MHWFSLILLISVQPTLQYFGSDYFSERWGILRFSCLMCIWLGHMFYKCAIDLMTSSSKYMSLLLTLNAHILETLIDCHIWTCSWNYFLNQSTLSWDHTYLYVVSTIALFVIKFIMFPTCTLCASDANVLYKQSCLCFHLFITLQGFTLYFLVL